MNKIFDKKILIVVSLIVILLVMIFLYIKSDGSDTYYNFDYSNRINSKDTNSDSVIISTSSQVSSALNEQIRLHATYKFKKLLVNKNELIKAGTKIIEYTNGKYLKAPYDLIITDYNLPSSKETCTTEHNISVSSYNVLSVSFRVSEEKINQIYLGQKATVKFASLNDKELEGYVTNISSTANNGRFTVIVEFDNDGDIRIGMSVNVII